MTLRHFLNWGWDEAEYSPQQLRRVRTLVVACLLLTLVGLPFLLRSIQWGLEIRITLLGTAMGLALLALWLIRRKHFVAGVHCMAAGVYLGGVNQYTTVGGMESGAVAWWLIVPLIGGLLQGLRTGLQWLVICLLTALCLFWVETHWVTFPNFTPPDSRNIQRVLMMVGEFAALAIIMSAYLTQIASSERRLLQQNQDLQNQVARAEAAEADALAAAEAKTRFLANMTHELRTPLNAILGFSGRLKTKLEGQVDARQTQALQTVVDSGEEMLELVTDMVDLANIEAHTLEMSRGLIDLSEMVNLLAPSLRLYAQQHQLTLTVAPLPEAFTRGDVSFLKRSLAIVMGHALQYCEAGEVHVEATVANGEWRFTVTGDRVRFSDEHRQRVFDRYHHLHSVSGRKSRVSGLAMVLAQELLRLHGGDLTLAAEGEGSRYCVTLPVA